MRRLLLATVPVDRMPDVPGLSERWGRDVFHCPYCHGYEVADQPLGLINAGPHAVHQAATIRRLTRWPPHVLNGTPSGARTYTTRRDVTRVNRGGGYCLKRGRLTATGT